MTTEESGSMRVKGNRFSCTPIFSEQWFVPSNYLKIQRLNIKLQLSNSNNQSYYQFTSRGFRTVCLCTCWFPSTIRDTMHACTTSFTFLPAIGHYRAYRLQVRVQVASLRFQFQAGREDSQIHSWFPLTPHTYMIIFILRNRRDLTQQARGSLAVSDSLVSPVQFNKETGDKTVKVKQSHYRPWQALRVPGIEAPRF
jgi:hypothetical protein